MVVMMLMWMRTPRLVRKSALVQMAMNMVMVALIGAAIAIVMKTKMEPKTIKT